MSNLGDVLEKKLAEAQAKGQVLNVSKLRTDGVGAVKAKRPATQGRDAKGAVKYIEGLDIISDNYGTYKAAADALGAPQFAKLYREFYGGGVASPQKPKSPKKEKTEAKNFEEKLMDAVVKAQESQNDEKAKLVDVSNLHELKNGSLGGFRTVNRYDPKTGKDIYLDKYTGKKMWIEGLPVINNNFDSYSRALNALDRADLVREFARVHGEDYDFRTTKDARSPARSPGGKRGPAQKLDAANQLYEMYSKAVSTEGKLDVSGLDVTKGTGSRVIYPKSDREITKVGVPGLPVVSNSHERFVEAMALLDEVYSANGNDAEFFEQANEYYRIHGAGPGKRVAGSPKAKTPKRVRAKSIPKVGSAGSSGSAGRSAGGNGRSRSGSLADRLARAASQERLVRSASQERLARSASQERLVGQRLRSASGSARSGSRSGSASRSGSRSGSADLLPVPANRLI